MKYSLKCPAKINLHLEILGRRPDGYHSLWTWFCALEEADTLSAEYADSIKIEGAQGLTENPRDNLIVKAAELLAGHFNIKGGIRFDLNKILPAGAGLGGGSSDAAGALRLCEKIWDLQIAPGKMNELASQIGADVPFFLGAPSAFGSQTGTVLTPAPMAHPFWIVVGTPQCNVATAQAYGALSGRKKDIGISREKIEQDATRKKFYASFFNDFEEPILGLFPEIVALKEEMQSHKPIKTMLSGSGSSLFSLFDSQEMAQKCRDRISSQCRFSSLTRFLESPPDIISAQ